VTSQSASTAELIPLIVADGKHQGEVDLSVDIDGSGSIARTTPVSGDPDLFTIAEKDLAIFRYSSFAGAGGAHQHVAFLRGKEIKTKAPVYPPIARAAHVQGSVVLAAAIGTDGRVGDVKVLEGPPMLQGSAVQSLQQWTFPPAIRAGAPSPARALVTIQYNLF
jgi:TonB family protein